MNKHDRKTLSQALQMIESAKELIEGIAEGEREKFDNMPEGIQESEKGELMERGAEELEDIANEIETLGERVQAVIDGDF